MMGVAAMVQVPADIESARYHLETAKEMMDKLKADVKDEVTVVFFN
jgi:hypothetical protein